MKILFEDKNFIIADKPINTLSEYHESHTSFPFLLKEACALSEPPHPVHRLDFEVGGAMLLAKNAAAMSSCSQLVAQGLIKKEYLAVTETPPPVEEGVLKDLLFKQSSNNKTYVVDRIRKGVKEASLSYRTIGYADFENRKLTLLSVLPHTGRTHQIRVQFSSRRCALTGDKKYGGKTKLPLGLMCRTISFSHPLTKQSISVSAPVPDRLPFSLDFFYEGRVIDLTQDML